MKRKFKERLLHMFRDSETTSGQQIELFLDISRRLAPEPPQILRSMDAKVLYIEYCIDL